MDLIDALRDEQLDATAVRTLLERAAGATSREAWLAILRDAAVPRLARRLAIRRLLEAEARPDMTLAEVGALVAADAWLEPAHVRHVSVVSGKLPVRWLAEDLIVAIDVCPAPPGSGDRHRLLLYLRLAGQPELEEIARGLRGGPGGGGEVRELGFLETEARSPGAGADPSAAPRVPSLGALALCRRALCDSPTGMHTLVDVLVELRTRLPGPAMFDVYLQLRGLTGSMTFAVEVLGPSPPDRGDHGDRGDDDGELLTTGTLTLGASADSTPGPPPPALGVAIPNVAVGFERAGEHRLRIRCGDDVLGEHRFDVVDPDA